MTLRGFLFYIFIYFIGYQFEYLFLFFMFKIERLKKIATQEIYTLSECAKSKSQQLYLLHSVGRYKI